MEDRDSETRRPAGGGMLDLPLRGGGPEPATESPHRGGPTSLDDSPPPARAAPPPPRSRDPRRRHRRFWLLPAAVFLVAVGLAYLIWWPTPPQPVFSTAALEFGEQRIGADAVTAEIEIANAGERQLQIDDLDFTGEGAADYRLETEDCIGRRLALDQSCAATVRFAPSAMDVREAILQVRGNARDAPGLAATGTGTAPLAEILAEGADFGARAVGGTGRAARFEVVNRGTAALAVRRVLIDGEAASDFRVVSNECSGSRLQPSGRCGVRVVFSPEAAGPRQAGLRVESDSFTEPAPAVLRGEGEWGGPALDVEPAQIDFGEQLAGGKAATRALEVTNRLGEPMELAAARIAGGTGFEVRRDECNGKVVDPGATCRVEIAFSPRSTGAAEATAEVRSARGGRKIEVTVFGAGIRPELFFDAESREFGEVRAGGETGAMLRLGNRGVGASRVAAVEIAGGDDSFRLRRDGCKGKRLRPGDTCELDLLFGPDGEGPHRAELTVRSEPDQGPKKVRLLGIGVVPRLNLDQRELDFGTVARTTSRDTRVLISNSGSGALRVQGARVEGGDRGSYRLTADSCIGGPPVRPGGKCEVMVRFQPETDGPATAELVIEHDAGSEPARLAMVGVGVPPPVPRLEASPSSLAFGPVPVGERSSIQTLTIRNRGTGRLEFRDFRITGAQAGDFYVVPATCDATPNLVPASDCTIGLRFVPTAAGERSARLVVRHNAEGGETSIRLGGQGLAPSPGAATLPE